MKKLRSYLKNTIQTIIIVYIVGIVLLQIPAVQALIADSLASAIGRKLGTKVRIERVNLGFLNRAIIDNLTIYDQQKQKMLSASRVAAKIEVAPLLKDGSISITSAQLFGLDANFHKVNEKAKANYQFALDSLASKDKSQKSDLDLAIHSLVIRNGRVCYNRLDAPLQKDVFSLNHLGLSNLSGHIILNHATNNELRLQIKSLGFTERSGFRLDNLRLKAFADKKNVRISGLTIVTPNSRIQDAAINIAYELNNGKLDKNKLKASSSIANATLYAPDFKAFMPNLAALGFPIRFSQSSTFDGKQLSIKNIQALSPGKSLHIDAQMSINTAAKGHPFFIKTSTFKVSRQLVDILDNSFGLKIPAQVKNLGSIDYKGTLRAGNDYLSANGSLKSDAGNARVNLLQRGNNINITLNTPLFNVGRVLADPKFGYLSADINAKLNKNLSFASVKAKVPHFDFNGYSYRNIAVDGTYANDSFDGTISLDDPNGKLNFAGKVQNIKAFISNKQKISADAKVNIQGLNLQKLKLTNALGDRTISLNAFIKGSGASFSDINGLVDVSDLSVIGEGKMIDLPRITIQSKSSSLNNQLEVNTNAGNIRLNGVYDYATIVQSFKNILAHYMPSLIGKGFQPTYNTRKNNLEFELQVLDYKAMKSYLNLPVELKAPLYVTGKLNENKAAIELNLQADHLIYSGNELKDFIILINSDNRKLATTINGEYNNAKNQRVFINSIADITNNNINSNINFYAPGKSAIKGRINSNIALSNKGGNLLTKVHFDPSTIFVDTITLRVQPSDLQYSNKNLSIDHFEVSNKTQHLIVNGKTSGNSTDSLTVQLKDIDVPYILDIVNFHPVDFGGMASGTASIKSVFSKPVINAHLNIRQFTFEDGAMGDLDVRTHFNTQEGIVYIDGVAQAGEDSFTTIRGHVDIKNNYIDLPIYPHNTKLYFLESFCSSFMDDIEGYANGWIKVVGPLNKVNLEGDLTANGSVNITPTGTAYSLNNAHVRFIPNQIIFDNDTIRDVHGNYGVITGGLSHENLKHLAYNINIDARNLLSYNFPKQTGKESFWGVVYGTGNCQIIGRSGETTLNVNLSPNRNSRITYDAALSSTIDETPFIRWVDSRMDSIKIPEVDSIPGKDINTLPTKDIVFRNFDIPSDLHMNFNFAVNPNLTLEVILDEATRDNILLNGSGGIRATYYNKGAFQMFGNYVLDHGLYNLTIQNVIKKQFTFEQGSNIAFGGDPFNAALNLKGVYALNSVSLSDLQLGQSFAQNNTKVNCLLFVTGTPASPSVSFGVELPNLSSDAQQMVHSLLNSEQDLNQQALYLLAVGRFYPQGNNNAQREGNGQSSTALAMQSLLSGTLSQQINTVLSNVIKTNNWNFGANIATGNEGFENAEYEGLFSGSLLNNRLLFNGEVGYRDNVATNSSSFIGDFDLRYLIRRNGNIALHFYNKTNDRYFTRSSLTTQGFGIILKKDFNSISDLWRRSQRKNKKAGKKQR